MAELCLAGQVESRGTGSFPVNAKGLPKGRWGSRICCPCERDAPTCHSSGSEVSRGMRVEMLLDHPSREA